MNLVVLFRCTTVLIPNTWCIKHYFLPENFLDSWTRKYEAFSSVDKFFVRKTFTFEFIWIFSTICYFYLLKRVPKFFDSSNYSCDVRIGLILVSIVYAMFVTENLLINSLRTTRWDRCRFFIFFCISFSWMRHTLFLLLLKKKKTDNRPLSLKMINTKIKNPPSS